MRSRQIELTGGPGSTVPAYEARPDHEARSGLLLLHGEFGLDEYTRQTARRFGAAGYHVVAPNLFHLTGGGEVPFGESAKTASNVDAMSDEKVLADVYAAISYLRHSGRWSDDQLATLGFGLGGRFALTVAIEFPLGGAVSFSPIGIVSPPTYGSLPEIGARIRALQTPWLAMFGALDILTPAQDIVTLRERLAGARSDVFTEVLSYPRADRGFYSDMRATYQQEAASDSWQRVYEWFDKRVAERPSPHQAAWTESKEAATSG